jgi:phenylacetate-CoA ligase
MMSTVIRPMVGFGLGLASPARAFLIRSPRVLRASLSLPLPVEPALWRIGELRAWRAYESARRNVPAYRDFVAATGSGGVALKRARPTIESIPITDKANYVKRYSVEERCRDGRIPAAGVTIDESSGTSGVPNNWVRGAAERADVGRLLQTSARVLLGDEPLFVINAFALGPWATGMTISMSVVGGAVVKSTGPDIQKIVNTLKLFGPKYRYVICGYPPFLKQLIGQCDLDWAGYSCIAFCGGEGMSEGLRDYLLGSFTRVYSSFGASDLEINIAAENDGTVALRRLLVARPELREALGMPEYGAEPMVFQFNPLDYHLESTAEGELVVTVTRMATVAPKIRYNIHDRGLVLRYGDVRKRLKRAGVDLDALAPGHLRLPFLFHWGRSDNTVAFYGSKVTPADVEAVVFSTPELTPVVNSWALITGETATADKTLTFAFELNAGAQRPGDCDALRWNVLKRLAEVNQDYRAAAGYIPAGFEPAIEFHAFGEGPFQNYDIRLKHQYVQSR